MDLSFIAQFSWAFASGASFGGSVISFMAKTYEISILLAVIGMIGITFSLYMKQLK